MAHVVERTQSETNLHKYKKHLAKRNKSERERFLLTSGSPFHCERTSNPQPRLKSHRPRPRAGSAAACGSAIHCRDVCDPGTANTGPGQVDGSLRDRKS